MVRHVICEGAKCWWLLMFVRRLLDIVHCDKKLYMVFEYMTLDLKKYIDTVSSLNGLPMTLVKVCARVVYHIRYDIQYTD